MISYNDIIEISRLYTQNQIDNLFSFINNKLPSNNIIEFLQKCKNNKYIDKTDSIKLDINKKEIIIFKDNFLKNLPTYQEKKYKIDDYILTIGYPDTTSLLKASCIKKIQYKDTVLNFNTADIPLFLIKKYSKEIQYYLNKLNNTYTYYVNKEFNSGFSYNKTLIIHIVYLCFVQDYEYLLQQQLHLMREYNFTYQDFNQLSIKSVNLYIKLINKQTSKENSSV
tara:strand:+ start:16 stop:687 length:672 start_codon:yes stop_codon:yes gene_type:complete